MPLIGAFCAVVCAVALMCSAAAQAAVQTITIVNQAGVRAGEVRSVEWALQGQVNRQLSPVWQTPHVVFGPGGWPIILERERAFSSPCGTINSAAGCHWMANSTGLIGLLPAAAVAVGRDLVWSALASHELLEMLVDPSGMGTEVCDPVGQWYYPYRQVEVSAFITPSGGVVDSWRRR